MEPILVTLLTFHLERSSVVSPELQNMLFMSVTLLTFHPERSSVSRFEQPLNMLLMVVTLPVLKSESPSMLVRLRLPANMAVILVTLLVWKADLDSCTKAVGKVSSVRFPMDLKDSTVFSITSLVLAE